MLIRAKKAQSTLEYALLITVVIGGLLTMQSYMKRGLQGKLKETTDQIGEQYSPGLTEAIYDFSTTSSTTEFIGDRVTTATSGTQTTDTQMDIKPLSQESWPSNWE